MADSLVELPVNLTEQQLRIALLRILDRLDQIGTTDTSEDKTILDSLATRIKVLEDA